MSTSFDPIITLTVLTNKGGLLTKTILPDGVGGIVKKGAGTLTLASANLYTGTTSVEAGKLVIRGQQSGPVSIASGATCEYIYPPTITALTLAPGATLEITGLGPRSSRSAAMKTPRSPSPPPPDRLRLR